MTLPAALKRLIADEDAQAVVEYALLGAMILGAVFVTGKVLTGAQRSAFGHQIDALAGWRAP